MLSLDVVVFAGICYLSCCCAVLLSLPTSVHSAESTLRSACVELTLDLSFSIVSLEDMNHDILRRPSEIEHGPAAAFPRYTRYHHFARPGASCHSIIPQCFHFLHPRVSDSMQMGCTVVLVGDWSFVLGEEKNFVTSLGMLASFMLTA